MPKSKNVVCFDVGEKRIGVAVCDMSIGIAVPFETIDVDGSEIENISEIIKKEDAKTVVIGYPRNQSGLATKQTAYVENFSEKLSVLPVEIVFQDESLTSVMAEQQLISYGKPYKKSDIDSQAAAIILQDYIEDNRA